MPTIFHRASSESQFSNHHLLKKNILEPVKRKAAVVWVFRQRTPDPPNPPPHPNTTPTQSHLNYLDLPNLENKFPF